MKWWLVFLGSGLGGCLRLLTSELAARYSNATYPAGTLISNLLACLILGFVLGLFKETSLLDTRLRFFLAVGICGGFSTFSTFSNETLQLLTQQKFAEAFLYVAGSILVGLVAVFGGFTVIQIFK